MLLRSVEVVVRLTRVVSLALAVLALAPATGPHAASAELERLIDEVRTKHAAKHTAGPIAAAERAVELSPLTSTARLWLGRAYGQKALEAPALAKFGPARRCRTAFEKAVELDPSNVEARGHLVEFYVQAPGFLGGSDAGAREQADRILELDPLHGHLAWASIHQHHKDTAKAEAEYRAAAGADVPGKLDGTIALAGFYIGEQRFTEARAVWQAVLRARPDDVLARYQLARISVLSGAFLEEGVEHLQAFLAAEPPPDGPSRADARWRLALLYEKLGRMSDAQASLREALRLDPDHDHARRDLERLTKG
jgi:tetratricopeptide (TPR) repeat protein